MTTEEQAFLLDRVSVLKVISALRNYRQASEELLKQRYQDGECDAVALYAFSVIVEEIEDALKEEE